MADITTYISGTPFTIRVRSSLAVNRRVRWFNTYEARATADGDLDILLGLGSSIVAFQSQLNWNYVYVDEITISSWVPDSHPYNPLGFVTTSYNQLGFQTLGVREPVALRQTLFLKRMASTGLPGKLFLRGPLSNEDLDYGDGEWQLADPAGKQDDVTAAVTASGLTNYLNGVISDYLALCLIGDGLETRFFNSFAVAGTSDVKLNHKYFDRS